MRTVKCVAVGDELVGKTCLLNRYTTKSFSEDPPSSSAYSINVVVDGKPVTLKSWDTVAQEEYDRTRPLCYPGTNVFLICFSLDNSASLVKVKATWFPEVRRHSSDTPIILVGTKLDLRKDGCTAGEPNGQNVGPVGLLQGTALAVEMGATKYLECSALTGEGVDTLFEEAIRVALKREPKPSPRSCAVL